MADKKVLNLLSYKSRKKDKQKKTIQGKYGLHKPNQELPQKSERVLKLRQQIDTIGEIVSRL